MTAVRGDPVWPRPGQTVQVRLWLRHGVSSPHHTRVLSGHFTGIVLALRWPPRAACPLLVMDEVPGGIVNTDSTFLGGDPRHGTTAWLVPEVTILS